jgi:hypothetical protein
MELTTTKLIEIFQNFLKHDDVAVLVNNMAKLEKDIEDELKPKNNETLWWKFTKDDTFAWDIDNIINDLSLPRSHSNNKYVMKLINHTVEHKSLRTFFS